MFTGTLFGLGHYLPYTIYYNIMVEISHIDKGQQVRILTFE